MGLFRFEKSGGRQSAAVAQSLQQEGKLFGPGEGCHDPDRYGGDAEDNEDASEPPMSEVEGLNLTSSIAEAM